MSFNLSDKARRMLERYPRMLRDEPTSIEEIEQILNKKNCTLNHAVVDFQYWLGGYIYGVRGDYHKVHLGIGHDPLIFLNNEDDKWYCEFGKHSESTLRLVMDQFGAIYATPNQETKPIPVSGSIETFIECDAMLDGLIDLSPSWFWIVFDTEDENISRLEKRLESFGLSLAPKASDEYITWWTRPNAAVYKSIDWVRLQPQARICVYARSVRQLIEMTPHLADLAIDRTNLEHFYTYPTR